MLSAREESGISVAAVLGASPMTWFYLSFEFLLGLAVSGLLVLLGLLQSLLPRPPRDLSGDVVLVTGAASELGASLAEEFARGGCSVICVDGAESRVEETALRLRARYPGQPVQLRLGDKPREAGRSRARLASLAYHCDLWDREDVRRLALRVRAEVGRVDVLVTCAGAPEQGIFDTVGKTLMSHYWTVLAFLPAMLHQERAHVIGVTPSISTEDAYMGSKAAVAGLMDSLGQHFHGRDNRLTFITVAPKAEPRLIKQTEQEIAKKVVQAVQRDWCCISMSWSSKQLYNISCRLYTSISKITKWIDT